MERLFFELLQISLGKRVCLSRTPSADEWGTLYALTKKQSLVGVCFAGVQRLQMQQQTPPEQLYLQWMGMAAKIQQRNDTLNRQCAELQAKLSGCGLRSAVLKGQGVAALYKVRDLSTLRQSGDIDLWVDAPKVEVVELAKKTGSKDKAAYLHVGAHFFKDTDVELHYRPTYMRNPFHNKCIQEFCERHKQDWVTHDRLVVPSEEFNVVYLLSHIYRHLFGAGIGMRQIMDYYFVLFACAERVLPQMTRELDVNYILKSLGLFDFAGAVMYVLHVVFGMEEQYMICKPDEKRGKALLRHVMQTGNFGKMDKEQKVARQSLFGTMAYKVRQWWVLLRYYPAETIWSSYWAIVNRLNIL